MDQSLSILRACLEHGCAVQFWQDEQCFMVNRLAYVDAQQLALSVLLREQNRPRLLNQTASLRLLDPNNGTRYLLRIRLQQTFSEGPLFERMRAMLAGQEEDESNRLLAVDLYQLVDIALESTTMLAPQAETDRLAALTQITGKLLASSELEQVLDQLVQGLAQNLDMPHSLVLCLDESGRWLYTVASHGYPQSGFGAELALGDGVIGLSALHRCAIRLGWPSPDYQHQQMQNPADPWQASPTEISLPQLNTPHSQLAVPIMVGDWLGGVIYVESDQAQRFDYRDEDALLCLGQILGSRMRGMLQPSELMDSEPESASYNIQADVLGKELPAIEIRYFASSQSVFIGDEYIIKGIAGAVLWLLLRDFVKLGRAESSNKALRLDPRLKLPDDDNLETRILMLQRRLSGRYAWLNLDKPGRGRLRLQLGHPVTLIDAESVAK